MAWSLFLSLYLSLSLSHTHTHTHIYPSLSLTHTHPYLFLSLWVHVGCVQCDVSSEEVFQRRHRHEGERQSHSQRDYEGIYNAHYNAQYNTQVHKSYTHMYTQHLHTYTHLRICIDSTLTPAISKLLFFFIDLSIVLMTNVRLFLRFERFWWSIYITSS